MRKRGKKTVRAAVVLLLTLLCAVSLCLPALGARYVTTAVTVINSAPIAENIELTTYKNIGVSGTFKATDPDCDPVTFEVSVEPKKGTVCLGEDGGFVYTPNEGKSGRDKFIYIAIDSAGNISPEATVSIRIKRQSAAVEYSDMSGSDAGYAAARLADEGVFIGDRLGGEYFFRPQETVSRGEFIAMCMKVCGSEPLDGIVRTAFADDEAMPGWVRPYISAALLSGYISGYTDGEGRLVFSADADVTFSEAAVMLNNTVGITDVAAVGAFGESSAPAWAAQAAANLTECRMLESGCDYSAALTRADAAKLLSAAMDVLDGRGAGTSLLDRVR